MGIKIGVFHDHKTYSRYGEGSKRYTYLEEIEQESFPRIGEHIHLQHHNPPFWEVAELIHTAPLYGSEWACVVVVSKGLDEELASLVTGQMLTSDIERRSKESADLLTIYRFENPNEPWRRRRELSERHNNGETVLSLSEKSGVTPTRIRQLIRDWSELSKRYNRVKREAAQKDSVTVEDERSLHLKIKEG